MMFFFYKEMDSIASFLRDKENFLVILALITGFFVLLLCCFSDLQSQTLFNNEAEFQELKRNSTTYYMYYDINFLSNTVFTKNIVFSYYLKNMLKISAYSFLSIFSLIFTLKFYISKLSETFKMRSKLFFYNNTFTKNDPVLVNLYDFHTIINLLSLKRI